ncbi:MAG: hypothetical protein HY744_04775 [Deltaproteobacteria bacterium]|nr:hypothetical protein [Deltaproteobacteria bacterium]
MRFGAFFTLVASGGAIAFFACSSEPEPAEEEICPPGQVIFCRCPGGEGSGTKTCNEDGKGSGPCEPCEGRPSSSSASSSTSASSSSSSSSSSSTSGGGGGQGNVPLYEPCEQDGECASGKCPMGYCTKDCAQVTDCELGVAECVSFGGETVCRPVCKTQEDCKKYGCAEESVCSACGYGKAVDDWGVKICADWGAELAFPPEGTECKEDWECNLGIEGAEHVCQAFGTCMVGCYEQKDCPKGKTCSSQGAIGKCQ